MPQQLTCVYVSPTSDVRQIDVSGVVHVFNVIALGQLTVTAAASVAAENSLTVTVLADAPALPSDLSLVVIPSCTTGSASTIGGAGGMIATSVAALAYPASQGPLFYSIVAPAIPATKMGYIITCSYSFREGQQGDTEEQINKEVAAARFVKLPAAHSINVGTINQVKQTHKQCGRAGTCARLPSRRTGVRCAHRSLWLCCLVVCCAG